MKDQKHHYIITPPESQNSDIMEGALEKLTFEDFKQAHDDHWKIEQYHRAKKPRFFKKGSAHPNLYFFCEFAFRGVLFCSQRFPSFIYPLRNLTNYVSG